MIRLLAVMLFLCGPLAAQNSVTEAFELGRRLALEQRELERAERQRQFENEQARKQEDRAQKAFDVQLEQEKLRLQRERLKLELAKGGVSDTTQATPAEQEQAEKALKQAMLKLAERYSDFAEHVDAIAGLTTLFAPGTSSEWTLERYLEGLYLIAKHGDSPTSSGGALVSEAEFVITSEPQGAEILVNGEFAGSTPTTRTVAPGQYMVEISKQGSRSWLRSVNIKVGDSVALHAELQSLQPKPSGN